MPEYNLLEAAQNVADKHGVKTALVLDIAKDLVGDFKKQLIARDEIHVTGFGSFVVKARMFDALPFVSRARKMKLKIKFNASDLLEDEINAANP